MGLLDFLFGRDTTADWVERGSQRLEADLDRHALCRVRVGEPIAGLSGLGPAEDRAHARKGFLRWFKKGLSAEVARDTEVLDSFQVHWRDSLKQGYRSYRGTCRYRATDLTLGESTRQEEVVRLFGEPADRDSDEDESVLTYRFAGVTWEIEFTPEGALAVFNVYREPPPG